MKELMKYTKEQTVIDPQKWRSKAEELLKAFEMKLVIAVNQEGYDGDDDNIKTQWTFSGALLYSIAVFTTIGKETLFTDKILLSFLSIQGLLLKSFDN